MIHLQLQRKHYKDLYIIGVLSYYDDRRNSAKICDTLEPNVSHLRPKGPIPAGTYRVVKEYSPKFKTALLEIKDIKGFSEVKFHWGNTIMDTLGCPLVGINNVKGQVTSSRSTYAILDKLCHNHQSILLTIYD